MRTFIGVSLLTGVLMVPGVAMASSCPSSGVHVDQGSPAAKQYGFPVNNARGETSGCSGKHNSAGGAGSQLFGAGVSPHKSSTHSSTTSKSTTSTTSTSTTATTATTARKAKAAAVPAHKKRDHHSKQVAAVSNSAPPSPPAKPVSASLASHVASPAATGGSSAWIALVGGGLLVLVLGTGAGLALKRRL
jgi:hypothetical protein